MILLELYNTAFQSHAFRYLVKSLLFLCKSSPANPVVKNPDPRVATRCPFLQRQETFKIEPDFLVNKNLLTKETNQFASVAVGYSVRGTHWLPNRNAHPITSAARRKQLLLFTCTCARIDTDQLATYKILAIELKNHLSQKRTRPLERLNFLPSSSKSSP